MPAGPTPDVLLLELLDTLQLAFPRPIEAAQLHFAPTDDGRRPALRDLEGRTDADAPPRPDLGHDDAEVLDTLQAILLDLVASVNERAGVFLTRGRVELRPPDARGNLELWLVEGEGEDATIRVRRTYDQSERQGLLFTRALFARLAATEDRERALFAAGQATLGGAQYALDAQLGRARFERPDAPTEERPVALVGTYHGPSASFVWGWANEAVPAALRAPVDAVRQGATDLGLSALALPELVCPAEMARRLSAHAAVALGAEAVFTTPWASSGGEVTATLAVLPAGAVPGLVSIS